MNRPRRQWKEWASRLRRYWNDAVGCSIFWIAGSKEHPSALLLHSTVASLARRFKIKGLGILALGLIAQVSTAIQKATWRVRPLHSIDIRHSRPWSKTDCRHGSSRIIRKTSGVRGNSSWSRSRGRRFCSRPYEGFTERKCRQEYWECQGHAHCDRKAQYDTHE